MGCSSSSTQTVDQEKRPGIKPEESNGDTVAVKNSTNAEDVQTIEDLLSVQSPPNDDLKVEPESEEEDVLVAMEAQEDLGSGKDLLAAPEPQPEPADCQEFSADPVISSLVEGSAEQETAVAEVEATVPVETELAALPPVADVHVEPEEQAPTVESVEVVQTEDSDADVSAVESVVSEPAGTPVIVEETQAEALDEATIETPAEKVSALKAEDPADNSAPETVSDAPSEVSENALSDPLVPDEAPTQHEALSVASAPNEAAEPPPPADAVKPLIDTALAEATIPEMPSSCSATAASTEEAAEVSITPAVSTLPAETPVTTEATAAPHTEVDSAEELVQNSAVPAPIPGPLEAPSHATTEALQVTSESTEESAATAEVPIVESIPGQSEAPSAPEPVADPAPEPLFKVASADEVSQETGHDTAKKED